MNSIIHTYLERCRGCYACVRGCPSKAIKVENRKAEVMPQLCVNCGACVRVCVSKAKVIESDISLVNKLLAGNNEIVAIPSAAFPAALPGIHPGQLVSALRKLGFSQVIEEAFGAELVSREYVHWLKIHPEGPIFSSNCPALVSYVEKFYPKLVDHLAPIVSPMIACGRLVKKINPDAKVVYIGPCAASKAESKDKNVAGVIDAVLTFPEIMDMIIAKKVDLKTLPNSDFDGPRPDVARLYAVSGGLLQSMGYTDDISNNEIVNAHGREYCISLLREIATGDVNAHFINFIFCHGCISGPAIDNHLSVFRRRNLVVKYTLQDSQPLTTEKDCAKFSSLNLTRKFDKKGVNIPNVSEEEIEDMLVSLGKGERSNRFNCGACGYRSCADLAAAVIRGQAEPTMCWPHLLTDFQQTQAGLIQAEKLTSLGQMAASIAHEVNNPLAGVLMYTQLLNKKMASNSLTPDTAQGYLNKMEAELNRSTKLIRNLMDFARQSDPMLKETDINSVIKLSLDLVLTAVQAKSINIKLELKTDLPPVKADPEQLQQVFLNLILNAVQSMSFGGTLTLGSTQEDGHIKIIVQDTGSGISEANLKKLFTPFFTTKKEVKGVGLGLAVSYGIIQRHHGKIEVKSKEGAGTTFTIYLPENYARKN
jgi:two-component system, NtrC family, sensor kinase